MKKAPRRAAGVPGDQESLQARVVIEDTPRSLLLPDSERLGVCFDFVRSDSTAHLSREDQAVGEKADVQTDERRIVSCLVGQLAGQVIVPVNMLQKQMLINGFYGLIYMIIKKWVVLNRKIFA